MKKQKDDLARVLVSTQQIQSRIKEIAAQINHEYAGQNELVLIGILKGAFIFLSDLARAIEIPHTVDFMALSSYGKSGAFSSDVRLIMDLREPIENKHIIIVEDILDSGATLDYLIRMFSNRNPASLKTCVLLRKPSSPTNVPIDYLGFEIPDVWVVGYGLDYADSYRTLPFIAELKKEIYSK